ncbi:aldolase citrate lyase family [Echria macrotheca]|uniref:Aldolase citrate lyase family n=1 Tax=Echria macrotheca TaxID=438768 RepID=A0AAJ0BNB6_9PEZI|nr:aldolase citrate lyase family [Echria macrotheca]
MGKPQFEQSIFKNPTGMQKYVSTSLQQPHRARQALRDAHEKRIPPLLGCYLGLSSIPTMRYIAPMGFDMVWIDWEHTACDVETMTSMVHDTMFMSYGKTIPFVRVPGHDHAIIGYALDAGASIVVPQVDTVEQAKHIIEAAKFGTTPTRRGTRSVPPFRLTMGYGDVPIDSSVDIWHNWNDQAAVIIQIESLEGIHNLDAILTEVPEIDAVWLGSIDARVSMNLRAGLGLPTDEPEWLAAYDVFMKTMKKHDKPLAGWSLGTPEQALVDGDDKCFMIMWGDVVEYAKMGAGLAHMKGLFTESRKAQGLPVEGEPATNGSS